MKFHRPCGGAPKTPCALDIRSVDSDSHELEEAAARGARVAVTETGERLPDKPSNSYRNIPRAGFQEAYLRQNFLSPAF